jgi:hypothetical protein
MTMADTDDDVEMETLRKRIASVNRVRFAARARTVTPIKGVLKKPEVVIPV